MTRAVLFDFMGVVGYARMAVAGDPGDHPQRVLMHEEVVDALQRLRQHGVKLALVSNNDRTRFSAVAPDVVERLEELFHAVVYSSDAGTEKPDPTIYRYALKQLGDIEPEDAYYFDDVARNVDAAERIGMQATVVTRTQDVLDVVEELLGNL
jgi:epoxide hydrolase-like predicted phosphatase